MDQAEFEQLAAEGYTHIPVCRELLADLDTPLSVYLKLADGPYAYLLESVEGGETWGRYSMIGLPCATVYRATGHRLVTECHGEVVEERDVADPIAEVSALRDSFRVPRLESLPPFTGGLVGFFGYECIQYLEPRLSELKNHDELDLPDLLVMRSEEVVVFDNLLGKLFILINVDTSRSQAWAKSQRRLDELAHRIRTGSPGYHDVADPIELGEADFVSGFTKEGFESAVKVAQEYINAGDIMQVVLSQRMSVPFKARPIDVYRALRSFNPSPYMYFLDLGETQIVGSSPEILVRVENADAIVRPIAGTRPRGATPELDAELERELLADPKELAEHIMLLDLGRNDVGRTARTGSVRVTDKMTIERYSHVMHIVSEVRGKLIEGAGLLEALKATFPAGTVSGAPKVRAMEIIEELEPVKRNLYAGAVGYVSWWNEGDLAIAIRTAVIKNGRLYVQAGGGIVADSVPSNEWDETMNKGRALFRAVSQAVSGL